MFGAGDDESNSETDSSDMEEDSSNEVAMNSQEEEEADKGEDCYPIGQYVAAVYQGQWYLGQVIDKKDEARALQDPLYLYVSYMERVAMNIFKWPVKIDKLNTLKEDVLLACQPPLPSSSTSSSRNITYSISKEDISKVVDLFLKDYNHTYLISSDQIVVVCVCVYQYSRCMCASKKCRFYSKKVLVLLQKIYQVRYWYRVHVYCVSLLRLIW